MRKSIKYIIMFLTTLLIFYACYNRVNSLSEDALTMKGYFQCFSDGFFASGLIFLGIGGLIWTASEGIFDGFTYSVSNIFKSKTKKDLDNGKESFYDYKQRIHENKTKKHYPFLIYGGALIVLAIVSLIVYYNIN